MNEMVNISAVTIWKDGVSKTAEVFSLRSIGDDLATTATFYYELRATDGEVLTSGNLVIEGADYTAWNGNPDINTEAYNWAATELNLTII